MLQIKGEVGESCDVSFSIKFTDLLKKGGSDGEQIFGIIQTSQVVEHGAVEQQVTSILTAVNHITDTRTG